MSPGDMLVVIGNVVKHISRGMKKYFYIMLFLQVCRADELKVPV